MNGNLFIGIACIGAALWIQNTGSQSYTPAASTTTQITQSAPYSAAYTESGYPIIGTPEQITLAQQADWLVEQFDQQVYGTNTPRPTQLFMSESLYSTSGRRAYGIAHMAEGSISLESGRSLRDVAGTLFHERLHLAYEDHPTIYPLQDQFVQLLIQQGY